VKRALFTPPAVSRSGDDAQRCVAMMREKSFGGSQARHFRDTSETLPRHFREVVWRQSGAVAAVCCTHAPPRRVCSRGLGSSHLLALPLASSQVKCELYDGVTDYRAKALREAGTCSQFACSTAFLPSKALREAAAASSGGKSGADVEAQEAQLESFAQWLEADSTDDEIDPEAGGD